jgi:hypothetical protein
MGLLAFFFKCGISKNDHWEVIRDFRGEDEIGVSILSDICD